MPRASALEPGQVVDLEESDQDSRVTEVAPPSDGNPPTAPCPTRDGSEAEDITSDDSDTEPEVIGSTTEEDIQEEEEPTPVPPIPADFQQVKPSEQVTTEDIEELKDVVMTNSVSVRRKAGRSRRPDENDHGQQHYARVRLQPQTSGRTREASARRPSSRC